MSAAGAPPGETDRLSGPGPPYPRALLDTSVVIDYDAPLVSAQALAGAITTVTLAELSYGLHTADPVINAVREERYHWITSTFDPIPFGPACARAFGALCAQVRDIGRDPKPRRFDLLIAAVALAHRLPLLTRNAVDLRGLHHMLTVVAI